MSDESTGVVRKLEPVAAGPAPGEKTIWVLDERATKRPLASEDGHFTWNMQRVRPPTLPDRTPHPGRTCAIFVVHGIGQQHWTETAAQLRAGFEDAFENIADWQRKAELKGQSIGLSAPFIYEGYWADYDNVKETFPEDFKHFSHREQDFFRNLWKHRVISGGRTVLWTLRQQFRLLHPRVFRERPLAWILYWPFQVVSVAALLYSWLRHRAAITGYLNDVRLYLDPRGVVERAIVQEIDARVERSFLHLIGLDMDFRALPSGEWVDAGGERYSFERVVWVAHSLGTVISYNVLSDLFHKAASLEHSGDKEQQEGVRQFRRRLTRFVTMGSPLDKVAFLFKERALRQWPGGAHRSLLESGERLTGSADSGTTEWWINFYHVLDPVSGALQNPFLCGTEPPSNIHIRSGFLPAIAHLAYWTDNTALRFILGRTYGAQFLKDQEFRPWPLWVQRLVGIAGYFTFAGILIGSMIGLIHWGPEILDTLKKAVVKWITG
jgi:hypothetical protein